MSAVPDRQSGAWSPFGRPLFDDPDIRKLSRVGVVDIGSNSVRLVIFDGAARSPAYFFNEKVMCGLGDGMAETGRLNPDGKTRALAAIHRFQALADGLGIDRLSAVATAAMRDAADGPDFRDQILRETGLDIFVIDGAEEARLAAQGVLLGWPRANGVVSDIGGSSMELAAVREGVIDARATARIGPLKLRALNGSRKQMRALIADEIEAALDGIERAPRRLFLVGGSWRAIAKLDMARRDYPLTVLHEYRMSQDDLRATLAAIADGQTDTLRAAAGVSAQRAALVPLAGEVMGVLLDRLDPGEIAVSSYGLREGLLYEQMPQALRDRDPLIEAAHFAEAKDARVPGFGKVLYRFIRPLYADAPPSRLRLVHAACLLHDVSWRSHPDYRADVCFDYATRANFGGLSHGDRVFLALALLHRYKNSRSQARFADLLTLLSEEEIAAAELLGKAMRFGAMFTAQKADQMGTLRWDPEARKITLSIGPQAMALYGEVAEARFAALGKALGAQTDVVALRRAVVR